MNIINKKSYIVKNRKKVIITKDEKGLIIDNKGNSIETIIVPKIFKFTQSYLHICFDGNVINGTGIEAKIVNRKRQVVYETKFNPNCYIGRPTKYACIALRINPKTKVEITKFSIDECKGYEEKIEDFCNENILLLTPGYPSNNDRYMCGFVHTRVKEYKKLGWNVDVFSLNDSDETSLYEYEGIKVCKTSYSIARSIIHNKKYEKILVHFFNESFANLLDAINITESRVYLYSHGADTMYRDFNKMTAKYFEQPKENSLEQNVSFRRRDKIIEKYNNMPNVKWFFVTDWTRRHSEELNNIKYNNYEIVPCYIDENVFKYEKKNSELRKKIFIIRKFEDINTYSIDIDVRTIIELSRRPFFEELEFNIYGTGSKHDVLLNPIKKFKNVHIYNKFLTHEQIAQAHRENGIALFATRYDSQAVSACEAAMSGLVVISSDNTGVYQEINPEFGTLCSTENYVDYADKIEELYYNPDLFENLSKKMHEYLYSIYGYDKTIQKEIDIFKEDDKSGVGKVQYNKQEDKIILTIAIPSYNVGKFLKNGVYSLINHDLSNKLEVLIVNDGSKDDTASIAKELEKITTVDGRSIVKLIDKENGGHGSTINKGIELARGKYFKLMDGDDYFETEELKKLINILEHEDSDIVLNNYIEDLAMTNTKKVNRYYEFMYPGLQYKMDDLCYDGYGFSNWGPLLSTSTYKTQMLKDANFKISEKCFYVDMELNVYSIINAKTIVYYPLDLYVYYIGRSGQSISRESYTRNYKNHEHVTMKIINEYYNNPNITEQKRRYIKEKIIIPLIVNQYIITNVYFTNGEAFRSFDSKLKKYDEFYNIDLNHKFRMKIYRITNGRAIRAFQIFDGIKRRIFG
ncbi:MAG: glycosyltransferase [Clostridia bacterium]|nr:glycosyltransferase [Clostridia bacterium]